MSRRSLPCAVSFLILARRSTVRPFIRSIDPGYCVNSKQKHQLEGCLGSELMRIFAKCTLSGTEECDASSAKIIRACFSKNMSGHLRQSAASRNCHKLLNEASLKCMTKNWSRSLSRVSANAIREQPMPRNPGQREVEFS